MWREKVAKTVFASPWGANDAQLDSLIVQHNKDLALLEERQQWKLQKKEKEVQMRRTRMQRALETDERKTRATCRKENFIRRLPNGEVGSTP